MNEGDGKGLVELPVDVLKHIALLFHDPAALLKLQWAVESAAQAFIDADATDEERTNLPRVDLPTADVGGERASRRWGVIAKYKLILNHREPL